MSKVYSWNNIEIEEILEPLSNGTLIGQGWSPQCEKEASQSEDVWGVLKTTSIQAGYFLENQNKRLPDNLDPRPQHEVKPGDILITCAGPRNRCGVACLVRRTRKRLMISGKMYRFRVSTSKAMPEYIELYLQYHVAQKQIDGMKTGGSESGLNLTHARFRKLRIPLPSVDTQQKIVSKIEELFSELDKGVEELKKVEQQLKIYRQAVLKWAFEGRFTNIDLTDGVLPKTWKWVKLGETCSSVEYGTAAKSKNKGQVPVLRMGNIQGGRFQWDDLVFTDDQEEIQKYLLKRDDVLFNRTNSPELVGKTAIYKGERPAIFAGYLIRINRKDECIGADYLNYFLNSEEAKNYGSSVKTDGVNQSNINGTKLKTYPIPLAPLIEQERVVQEIERRTSLCDKMEETVKVSIQQATALKQSILKKAFEGELA
jgi:type I restriction enzyme S subunit